MWELSRGSLANNTKKYANSRISIDFKDRARSNAFPTLID
jgi:hypothetical protein